MIAALLTTLLAADPCEPLANKPDAREAAAYLEVAREEEAQGAWGAALEAYRRAAGRAPRDASARAGLQRACSRHRLEEAETLLSKGDSDAALQRLSGGVDLPSALLQGSMLAERGRLDEARELLTRAQQDEQLAGTAALQLALLELRAGHRAEARRWIAEAERDPKSAALAAQLEPLAAGSGRVRAQASVEAGYDTNPLLVPGIGVFGSATPDGFVGAGAQAVAAPWGTEWPRLELRGAYRKYFSSSADDTGLAGAGLRHDFTLGPVELRAAYDFDYVAFGEAPWLIRNALELEAATRWRDLDFGVGYQPRHEAYLQPTASPDSGPRHAFRVWAGARLGRVDAELAWIDTLAPLAVKWRGYNDTGAELTLAASLTPFTVVANANLRDRHYDAVDPDLHGQRDDVLFEAQVRIECQLTTVLRLYLAGEARSASSNIDGLSYTRFVVLSGLSAQAGWL